ncbi:NUDIX domain-containing protein [bacterium]|nr:MAG: NUDIX domain-containing protein [bacterium]
MASYRLAAYGLLIRDESILLCRLGEKESECGLWTLPGGGFEPGESPEQAALREIEEETGLDAELGPLLYAETTLRRFDDGREVYQSRFYFLVKGWAGREGPEANCFTDAVEWHLLDAVSKMRVADVVNIGLSALGE